jgi:hypothetical protein
MNGAQSTLGTRFAGALAAKDHEAIAAVLHPEIDFRGLTPNRVWEATDVAGVVDVLLSHWFESADVLDELVLVESDAFADREQVRYRFAGHNEDGPFVVEQQAYVTARDGRVGWMRVVCSGFRSPD